MSKCSTCRGTGELLHSIDRRNGHPIYQECPNCEGQGVAGIRPLDRLLWAGLILCALFIAIETLRGLASH